MTSRQPEDKVIDHTLQQLSALFDGELGLEEARFLQRRLGHDRTLAASWSRWQLAGDALRGQAVAAAPAGFAEQVAAAVAAEATPGRTGSRRGRLLPGAALAASVAALAMFMTRQAPEVAPPAAPAMEVASAVDTVPAPSRAPQPSAPAAPAAPDTAPAGMLEAAGTAIAAAEVPRRAAERRSRGQQQRAAATRVQRSAAEPRLVAASAPAAPAAEAQASPFVPEAAADTVTTRPWPRALLPGSDAFTVGYGRLQQAGEATHPFQPRPVALPQVPSNSAPEDTD